MTKNKKRIGIIGGTGLYKIDYLKVIDEINLNTPWGFPSDPIMLASAETPDGQIELAFLSRHGAGHRIIPAEIPVKANMAALKMVGVDRIVSFSAVGSLKEEIHPTDFIVPDQIIDRTRQRSSTYFGDGIVAHVSFGDPFCAKMAHAAESAIRELNIPCHTGETMICMEGPAFSTRAESKLYKSWGAGIINMSVLPEAKLARELEICYQMICMSTDYDSWRESEEAITTEEIMKVVHQNSENANRILMKLIPKLAASDYTACSCQSAMKYSIMTAPEKRPDAAKVNLHSVLPEYF